MDQEAKKFFEELSHTADEMKKDEASSEPHIEFAKATSIPLEKKSSKKSNQDLGELLDEDGQLAIDVYQTPEEIVIESAIAGVKPEDLDIDITPDSITVRGKRLKERKVADEDYFYQECYWGRFSRSVILPQEVDSEKADASLKNGVLIVRLPKLDRQKSKKLKIKFD